MSRLARLVLAGGSLGLGLVASGVMAVMDLKKMKNKKNLREEPFERIRPRRRRVYLWPH